jgi:hypothetical protein
MIPLRHTTTRSLGQQLVIARLPNVVVDGSAR